MSKRKVASVAFTGATVAATTLMGVPAAFASGGLWVVKPPTSRLSGTVTLGVSQNGTTTLSCKGSVSAHLSNNVPIGNPWAKIGTVSHATFGPPFNPCALGNIKFTASLKKTVNLSLSGSHASHGRIHGSISITLTGTSGRCRATFTGSKSATAPGAGTVPASWNNISHQLNINKGRAKTLVVRSAHSCIGIANGGPAFLSGTLRASKPVSIIDP